jgi:hypothetical protein
VPEEDGRSIASCSGAGFAVSSFLVSSMGSTTGVFSLSSSAFGSSVFGSSTLVSVGVGTTISSGTGFLRSSPVFSFRVSSTNVPHSEALSASGLASTDGCDVVSLIDCQYISSF